jgi:PKD domain/CARDB
MTKKTLIVALLFSTSFIAKHAHAAYTFQFLQSGSLNSLQSPLYSVDAQGYLGWAPVFGLPLVSWPDPPIDFNPSILCGYTAAQANLAESSPYTCVISSATFNTTVSGIPSGGGGGLGGANFGCGMNCISSPFSYPYENVKIYSGNGGPFRTECPLQNGPISGGGGDYVTNSSCLVLTNPGVVTPPPQIPVATLVATPSTVVQGNNSALTYSCSNTATSAVISSGVGTQANPTAGTVAVVPTTTTTYTLTCANAQGTSQSSETITVIPALTGSCTVSPVSILSGGSATWTAVASGGVGSFTYAWDGTDGLTGTNASVSKLYSAGGIKTASVTITSGSQTITPVCTNSLMVTAAPLPPNLTAGSVTPTTATAGIPVTLSATASNIGTGISGSFPVLFQVQSPANLTQSPYIGPVAAGAGAPASVSQTFATAGTYQVRACANNNTSWTNIVTESNYADNCGPWTPVTVSAAATPTASCTPSTTAISTGGSVTFTALGTGGALPPYTWTDSDSTTGSGATFTRTYTTPGIYQMQVRASNTSNTFCSPSQVTVTGTTCTLGVANLTITAIPDRVKQNDPATISWTATNVQGNTPNCTVTGPGVSVTTPVSAQPSCSITGGSATPTITNPSVYTLTCGADSKTVRVNVVPGFVEF